MTRPVLIIGGPSENFDAKQVAARIAPSFPGLQLRASADPESAPPLAKGAGVIMGFGQHFSEATVTAAGADLEWIQSITAGTDAIFAIKALRPEVRVTSMAGVHGPQMAEMAFLHMMSLARRFPRMLDNQRAHKWERWQQPLLQKKTVVILGTGTIARVLAKRCKAFEMQVIGVSATPRAEEGYDRMMPRSELGKAVGLADFLVVLIPLSPQTRHIVDARVLAAMKPTAYLINLARGGVCDEQALIAALRAGRIAGAGLDVFEREPLPPEDPIWDAPNTLVTAHMGGYSDTYLEQMIPIIEGNLRCYIEGRGSDMKNVVRG